MTVGCVLVLYNPNVGILRQCLKVLNSQVDMIAIVDNSTKSVNYSFDSTNYVYYSMNGNYGIAAAQNKGIEILKNYNIDYLLFLDQDSIAPENLVEQLVEEAKKLKATSVTLGGIGPRPLNRQSNKEYRGSVKKGKKYSNTLTEVRELISSGTLIPFENFSSVGLMDSALFIDGVDHEWCWRAYKKIKARFFILETVFLSHQLGEGDHNFFFKKVAIPTPFRVFYQYRNYFILLSRSYVPVYWKFANGFKYIIKLFYYPFFIPPRSKYFKNICRGIYCGIFNQ